MYLTDTGKLDLGQQEPLLPAVGVLSITGNLFLHDITHPPLPTRVEAGLWWPLMTV